MSHFAVEFGCKDEKDTLAFSELNAFPEYSLVLRGSCTKYEVNGSTQSSYRLAELIFDLKKAGKSEIQIPLSKLLEPNVFLKEIESASWQYAKTYIEKSLNEKFLNFGGHSIVVTLPSTLSGLSGEVEVSINGQTIPPYSFKLLEKDVQKQIQELYTGLVRHIIHKKFKQQLTKQCKTAVTRVNKLLPIKGLTDSEISQRCDKFDVEHLQQDINSFSKIFVISQVKNLILNSQEVTTLISNINNFVGARVVVVQNDNLYIEGELIEVRGKTISAAIDSWIVSSRKKIQHVLENKLREEIFKDLDIGDYLVSIDKVTPNEKMTVKIVRAEQVVMEIDIQSLLNNPEKEITSKLQLLLGNHLDQRAIELSIKVAEKALLTLNPEIKLDPSADKLKATWSKGKTRWRFTKNYQNASDIGKFVEAATIDYSIFQAQLALNKSIETPLNNLCAKINRSELSSFPVPLSLQCSENRDVTASFELMGETFIVKSGIDFKSGEFSNGDIKTISPEINLAKLKVSPSISSFVTTKLNDIAPDIKVQDVRFESKSIHLDVSYYFSPLDTNIKTEIILDKQNGLSINVDSKAFAKQAICNGAKEYVVSNQNAINKLYKDVQISANPICTTNELTIPISVSMSAQSLGQFDIPGAVIVPLDGLPKIKLHLNDLFSFSNVLKEYLGSVNIGGTELREPYYHVENGEVKLFLRSALELEVIPGFGNIAADYSISNKGIKFDGTIWITSSIWYDIFPPYLAVGEFGVGLNPTEKTIALKGAATISPGEAVSTLARFNGEATLPLDITEAYFKMKGELLMPGQTKLAQGNACIGKAADCDVSDVSSKTHLLDVNINSGIPGLRFIKLDGNLRMQDDEEFIRVSAAGRLLGAELAKAKLTLSKALRGKLGAEIDLKIVNFEAEAKTSPALVPSALKFNGELKNVVKFSGMADIGVGVSAALEPQGDLKYIIPGFSITVPSFDKLFALLINLELSLKLGSIDSFNLAFTDVQETDLGKDNGKGKELDKGGIMPIGPLPQIPTNKPTPANTLELTVLHVEAEHCKYKNGEECDGDIKFSALGKKACLGGKGWVPKFSNGLMVKDNLVSRYFNIPRGQSTCKAPGDYKSLDNLKIIKQKNKYNLGWNGERKNIRVFIDENKDLFSLNHSKEQFKFKEYGYAVLAVGKEKKYVIIKDNNLSWYLLAGQSLPNDDLFKKTIEAQTIPLLDSKPFTKAHIKPISPDKEIILHQIVETEITGLDVKALFISEIQGIFDVSWNENGNELVKKIWSYFNKNLPRSFEIISDESKLSELFKLLNAFPSGVLTPQTCGAEQVRIDKATCGLVIQLTDKAALILSNHKSTGFSNAWLITEQHGVIAGQWRPSSKLLKEMANNNEPLIEHIKDSGTLKEYLSKAIHSKLTAGFNLILGKSECSLKSKGPGCKSEIRVATIYDSTTSDTQLEIFHSSDKCLLSSKKEINEFWQLKDLNLTRQENLIINGIINHEKMLESIIDESWQDNWRANPIGPFKQGKLNKIVGGCEYGNI